MQNDSSELERTRHPNQETTTGAQAASELSALYKAWRMDEDLPPRIVELINVARQTILSHPESADEIIGAFFSAGQASLRTDAAVLCAALASVDRKKADRLWQLIATDRATVVEASVVMEASLLGFRDSHGTWVETGGFDVDDEFNGLDKTLIRAFWEEKVLPLL